MLLKHQHHQHQPLQLRPLRPEHPPFPHAHHARDVEVVEPAGAGGRARRIPIKNPPLVSSLRVLPRWSPRPCWHQLPKALGQSAHGLRQGFHDDSAVFAPDFNREPVSTKPSGLAGSTSFSWKLGRTCSSKSAPDSNSTPAIRAPTIRAGLRRPAASSESTPLSGHCVALLGTETASRARAFR